MSRVWDQSTHGGTELLMLLALADFADDDGNAYPAVGTLAAKCRMSPRNANFILAALRGSGELEVRPNEGPRGTNLYRVVTGLKPTTPLKRASPLKPASSTPERGFPKPLKPASDEPSLNHQEPPLSESAKKVASQPTRRKTFKAWYDDLQANNPKAKIIRDDDPIRAQIESIGLNRHFLGLHWEWFKAKQIDSCKQQVDWLQTFRKSIMGNYGRLWYRANGVWLLTTAGKQAALQYGFPEGLSSG